ncbi:hypothetical protein OIO90_004582 [Microbotryomycetes sp. JL221]|nr:hypothetical protein OIO90_004582 [Microbotryomycetes sp. JL221]
MSATPSPVDGPSTSSTLDVQNATDRPKIAVRTSSLASDFGLYSPQKASSLKPPPTDPLLLTPLRAHYLKRELVTLEFVNELATLDSAGALSMLGPPFLPKSMFVNGVPRTSESQPTTTTTTSTSNQQNDEVDLPFLKFVFNHFVLTFPFLASSPSSFFSHKLQPFVYSFVQRNISTSDDRDQLTKRQKVSSKFEKHLGLVMSAAIKLKENEGREEVVRVEDDGQIRNALPATQTNRYSHQQSHQTQSSIDSTNTKSMNSTTKEEEFSINVVSVRNFIVKGRVRNKTHEEFIVRTRQRGHQDVYVARRYGDFKRLADTLRAECIEEHVPSPPAKDRRSTDARVASPSSSPDPSPQLEPVDKRTSNQTQTSTGGSIPALSRERNRLTLRAYLNQILKNNVLASTRAFQSFLIESPIELTTMELRDVEIREEMDKLREKELKSFKNQVDQRVGELEMYIREFREDMVEKDGLTRVFATIRETENVEDLPIKYLKVLEWARISLASTIYQLFLGSDNSSSVFAQLKRIHGLMPYFMLRGILKISNPVAMIRSILDLFLARPFGSTSLLQKMFTTGLNEEIKELRFDSELVSKKIGDDRLVEKIEIFVNASKEIQDQMRAEAVEDNVDIMTVILRSPREPMLDPRTMQYIATCSVAYEEYKHERDQLSDPEDDEGPTNDEAWLFEDCHVLKRILTKARDKEQMVELIFEGSTSELLKDIVTIFYSPLATVYKAANIADSLTDLQTFINDLIKTVESAENAKLTDPQKTVQIFVDLVARHEKRFYHFVHQVHSKGQGLFDNLMKWIELFINFVRDGLSTPVSLDHLLPVGGQQRKDIMNEVDQIVEYHRQLKIQHHERMKKRLMKGQSSDADADAAFVAGVLDNLHLGGMMGDVQDVAAEDTDDEDDFQDDESSEDDTPDLNKDLPSEPKLQMLPTNKHRDKRDKLIEPPKLKLVPQLVPLFVELVREQLTQGNLVGQRGFSNVR